MMMRAWWLSVAVAALMAAGAVSPAAQAQSPATPASRPPSDAVAADVDLPGG